MKHVWAALVASLMITGSAQAAAPVKHALLVAVEDYEALPGVSLFEGPRNSVLLWHDYLKSQGFTDITVLSEDINPTDVKWTKADPRNTPPTNSTPANWQSNTIPKALEHKPNTTNANPADVDPTAKATT